MQQHSVPKLQDQHHICNVNNHCKQKWINDLGYWLLKRIYVKKQTMKPQINTSMCHCDKNSTAKCKVTGCYPDEVYPDKKFPWPVGQFPDRTSPRYMFNELFQQRLESVTGHSGDYCRNYRPVRKLVNYTVWSLQPELSGRWVVILKSWSCRCWVSIWHLPSEVCVCVPHLRLLAQW